MLPFLMLCILVCWLLHLLNNLHLDPHLYLLSLTEHYSSRIGQIWMSLQRCRSDTLIQQKVNNSVFVEVKCINSCKSIAHRRVVSFWGFFWRYRRIFWWSSFHSWDEFEGSWDIFLTRSYVDTQVAECTMVMYKRKFHCCICCMLFTDDVCRSVGVTQTLSDNNVTVIGLLTDGEEAEYREEVKTLSVWCQENNISLNKTKDMITD